LTPVKQLSQYGWAMVAESMFLFEVAWGEQWGAEIRSAEFKGARLVRADKRTRVHEHALAWTDYHSNRCSEFRVRPYRASETLPGLHDASRMAE
jgi:hypothetical protein